MAVPHKATAKVTATAAKGGYVSYKSFGEADQRTEVEEARPSGAEDEHVVIVAYVVSADRRGQTKYRVTLREEASTDTGLLAIRSNVGKVRAVGNPAAHTYMLRVPTVAMQVAVSATARDREGAVVTVHHSSGYAGAAPDDRSGVGYASAVVQMRADSPSEIVHLEVRAADRVTVGEYTLVINRGMREQALLSSLTAKGCKGGLQPAFDPFLHQHRSQRHRNRVEY